MKLRDRNLIFVGMTSGDGQMTPPTRALWERLLQPIGRFRFISWKVSGQSISRSRNMLTAMALESDAFAMVMLDSDSNAGEDQMGRLLSHDVPIVGGIYPRKEVKWPTRWCVNFEGPVRTDGLRPAIEMGAGFFKVNLDTVERMIELNPETKYFSDEEATYGEALHDLWGERIAVDAWEAGKPPFPRKLSEDFCFCWLAKRVGFHVYADTLCQVGHIGPVDYLEVAALIQGLLAGKTPTGT